MSVMTITEALAAIKTTAKRIDNKKAAINPYLYRQEAAKDPLEKQGGSPEYVRRELQSIEDLQTNILRWRTAIARTNAVTFVTVQGICRTVEAWLIWRRDIAPVRQRVLSELRSSINNARTKAAQIGGKLITNAQSSDDPKDVIANFDEQELHKEIEVLDTILGELDGALSRVNATTYLADIE